MGKLYCPKCQTLAFIKLHTDDMDTLECGECDEQFLCADVRAMIESARKWEKLLAWIDTAPKDTK